MAGPEEAIALETTPTSKEPQQAAEPAVPYPAASRSDRIGFLIRKNSENVANAAEVVVLPKNRRSMRRAPDVDVESGQPIIPIEKYFPIFTILVTILEIIMFYYTDIEVQVAVWYDPYRRHELWRYFTVMLAHSSPSHLWGNMFFQLILGGLLEIVHGWKRVGTVYVCGVIGGTLAATMINPKRYALGASAGIYALLISHLATLILNWQEMERRICRIFWLLLYIAFDVLVNIYVEAKGTSRRKTSHSGHFGGAVAGFLIGVLVLKNFRTLAWEKTLKKVCIGITVCLLALVVIVNISFPSYYSPSEYNTAYIFTFARHICQDAEIQKLVPEVCSEVHIADT